MREKFAGDGTRPIRRRVGDLLSTPVPMLTSDNYTTWAIKVEANLNAAGLWEVVVLQEDAATAVITKKDKPARAYLLGALAENLLLQVSSKKTAAEVWASLKARFVRGDRVRAARLCTLRGDFELLRMAGTTRWTRSKGSSVAWQHASRGSDRAGRRRAGEEDARLRARLSVCGGGRNRAIL